MVLPVRRSLWGLPVMHIRRGGNFRHPSTHQRFSRVADSLWWVSAMGWHGPGLGPRRTGAVHLRANIGAAKDTNLCHACKLGGVLGWLIHVSFCQFGLARNHHFCAVHGTGSILIRAAAAQMPYVMSSSMLAGSDDVRTTMEIVCRVDVGSRTVYYNWLTMGRVCGWCDAAPPARTTARSSAG